MHSCTEVKNSTGRRNRRQTEGQTAFQAAAAAGEEGASISGSLRAQKRCTAVARLEIRTHAHTPDIFGFLHPSVHPSVRPTPLLPATPLPPPSLPVKGSLLPRCFVRPSVHESSSVGNALRSRTQRGDADDIKETWLNCCCSILTSKLVEFASLHISRLNLDKEQPSHSCFIRSLPRGASPPLPGSHRVACCRTLALPPPRTAPSPSLPPSCIHRVHALFSPLLMPPALPCHRCSRGVSGACSVHELQHPIRYSTPIAPHQGTANDDQDQVAWSVGSPWPRQRVHSDLWGHSYDVYKIWNFRIPPHDIRRLCLLLGDPLIHPPIADVK